MKNYLVFLVTIGIAAAYWYQLPEETKAVVTAPVAPKAVPAVAPTPTPRFVASHTSLDDPASRVGRWKTDSSLMLGNDSNNPPPH